MSLFEVQPHHLNGHGICHGGFIFTLADSAFAFACNSYNQHGGAGELDHLPVARPRRRAADRARPRKPGARDGRASTT
jgi:acyl-CoA thioesterase